MYGVLKCEYGSVPRAVTSALHVGARSLPLAVLIHRAFPYTQSQTDLNPSNSMDCEQTLTGLKKLCARRNCRWLSITRRRLCQRLR